MGELECDIPEKIDRDDDVQDALTLHDLNYLFFYTSFNLYFNE